MPTEKRIIIFRVSYNLLSKLKHFENQWECYNIYYGTKSINCTVKDKSGHMFTLVILNKKHFSRQVASDTGRMDGLSPHVDGREGTLALNGRPRR